MTHRSHFRLKLLATLVLAHLAAGFALAQGGVKEIPFSVTAGVPAGGATIGIKWPAIESGGTPVYSPAVFLPPGQDSFITQNVAVPPNLQASEPLTVDVFFSTGRNSIFPTEGPVNLTLALTTSLVTDSAFVPEVIMTREQFVDMVGGGLRKATFAILVRPLVGSDVLTIQLGRRAKENPRDTNPGDLRIEAVRVLFGSQ